MERGGPGNRRLVLVVIAITAVSVIAASVFADRSQAARVAEDGAVISDAQRLVAASSGLRVNLGITMVLVEATRRGLDVSDDVDAAIDQVRVGADALVERSAALDALSPGDEHAANARSAQDAIERVLATLETDPSLAGLASARALAESEALPTLDRLDAAAFATSQSAEARIQTEQERAGEAARASSLIVALVVPALAVLALWTSSRRRVERVALQAEIDKNLALVRARDELIAGIGHQLRTPLTGIIGFTDALIAAPDDADLRQEGLSTIQNQSGELARMIEDMLVMARLEDGSVEIQRLPIDPTPEVEYVVQAHPDSAIQTSLAPTLVVGDRLRLRHILTNLVSNAVAHGGESIVVKGAPTEHAYRLVVADNGSGVPAGLLDNVFRPFVHAPKDALVTGSLGLGLAVAKQLADQMDCDLSYQRLNGYTLFVLDLPLAEGRPQITTASSG